jgi:hypothetical protein
LNGGSYRGGMYRDSRPLIQGTSRETPREAGFYVRPVGFDPDYDSGGRAACRIARVKMDQIFDEGSGVQYELPEMKETIGVGGRGHCRGRDDEQRPRG